MTRSVVGIIIISVLLSLALVRCANSISPPSGGPKDLYPPVILETFPENGSPNFKTDRFMLRFNEFVNLENIQQSALISPPMKKMPDFRIKGKSIIVKFNEPLLENTTYSVYFGDAITDITEKNPLSNYTYIFSTGPYVDSLSLYGYVKNAFNMQPVKDAFVGLYKNTNDTIEFDSLPFLVPPYYLSKTDEKGMFRLTGLSDDKYFVLGLLDQNSNFFFDQPGEEIAFSDSLVRPYYLKKPVLDTVITDTTDIADIENDSIIAEQQIMIDSLFSEAIENRSIELLMFLSRDTIQRLIKSEVPLRNKIVYSFSQPAQDIEFKIIRYELADSLYIVEYSKNYDTITWHLNNPPTDSLEVLIMDGIDTLGISYLKLDPTNKLAGGNRKDEPEKEFLTWKERPSSTLNPDQQLYILFDQPMVIANGVDSSVLIYNQDTIMNPEFVYADTILYNKILVPFEPVEGSKYHIYFPDSSFSSWNNLHTKAINFNLKTLSADKYGSLKMNVKPNIATNYILQMLDDKENVLAENFFTGDTVIQYSYLKPISVKFKIIYDSNANKIWDTGDLGEKIQPEKVIYYDKEIKIRANWEIEEDWSF